MGPTKFIENKPEAIKALTFEQDLIWKHRLMSPLPTRGDARWNLGKSVILMWQGSANMTGLEQTVTTFEWDLGPRPQGPKSRGYIMSADMFAINSQSKNKEAAWCFLKYLTSTEGQEIYSKVFGRGPTRRSAFPYFQSLFPKRSTMYITLGMMEGSLGPEAFIPKAANDLILDAVRNQIATNAKSPQQAMEEIADVVNAAMIQ